MSYYKVTLNQGRTDTVTIEADSLNDVLTFFNTVSTANVTKVKKIVYSKELGIGNALTTYTPNNQHNYINIMVKNVDGEVGVLSIQNPLKSITKDDVVKSVKKNLLYNDKQITEIINIIIKR